MIHEDWTIDPLPAHLMIDNHAGAKAYEMRQWILARLAEGYTVEMIDPKRDGAEPYRMSNGQVLLPATWGNYTPKTPPVALAAVTGETINPRTAQYRPLDREVARAYSIRRGSDLTHPQLVMTDQAAEKSRAARRWIADRMAEGYTMKMIDPKDDGTDSNG